MHHIPSTISKHLVFEAASDIREQFGLEYPLSKNDIFSIIREYGGTIEKTTLLEDSFAIRRLGRHRFSIAVPAHLGRKDTPYFYAVALGFLFVTLFHYSGSLWPCIITHSLIDVTSVFANGENLSPINQNYVGPIVILLICAAYSFYIIRRSKRA